MSINRLITVAFLAVPASLAAGCGELFHKMEYDAATFSGPAAAAYSRMSTGELPTSSQIQHRTIADVLVRLSDGTIFELARFPEEVAKARAGQGTDVSGLTCYHLRDSNCDLYYRGGTLVGAVLADGMEIAKTEQGPFVKLPLSADEVRQVFGDPNRQARFRGPMKWN
jgi:hypothetical protein